MSKLGARFLRLAVMVAGLGLAPAMWAAHVNPHALNTSKPKSTKLSESQRTRRRMRHLANSRSTAHSTTAHNTIAHNTIAHSTTGQSATGQSATGQSATGQSATVHTAG